MLRKNTLRGDPHEHCLIKKKKIRTPLYLFLVSKSFGNDSSSLSNEIHAVTACHRLITPCKAFSLSTTPLFSRMWYLPKYMHAFWCTTAADSSRSGSGKAGSWSINVHASVYEWPIENWQSRCYCLEKAGSEHRSLFYINEDAHQGSCLVTGGFTWPVLCFCLLAYFLLPCHLREPLTILRRIHVGGTLLSLLFARLICQANGKWNES